MENKKLADTGVSLYGKTWKGWVRSSTASIYGDTWVFLDVSQICNSIAKSYFK